MSKTWKSIVVLLVTVLLLTGCTLSGISTSAVIRLNGLGNWGYPTPFAAVPRGPSFIRMSMTHDTLLWKDEDGLIPWLAESYEKTESGYIFHLRKDVFWSDGSPFTADDVVFTYDYYKKYPPKGFIWGAFSMVDKVEKIDDYTVRIVPTKDVPVFLDLAVSTVFILPKHIWEDVTEPYTFTDEKAFIGTGPFILDQYDATTGEYVYKPKDNWWGGKVPYTVKFINSPTPVSDFATGRLDMVRVWGTDVYAAKKLLENEEYLSVKGDSYFMYLIIFNTEKLSLQVRRALASVIDREQIVDNMLHGYGEVPRLVVSDMDKEEALDILRGIDHLDIVSSSAFEKSALAVKDQLDSLGIHTTIHVYPIGVSDEKIANGEFDIAINGRGGLAYGSGWASITWPYKGYKSERWDELARRLKVDFPEKYMDDMRQILTDEVPVLPLYIPISILYQKKDFPVRFFFTYRGVGAGIPIPINKIVFIQR